MVASSVERFLRQDEAPVTSNITWIYAERRWKSKAGVWLRVDLILMTQRSMALLVVGGRHAVTGSNPLQPPAPGVATITYYYQLSVSVLHVCTELQLLFKF